MCLKYEPSSIHPPWLWHSRCITPRVTEQSERLSAPVSIKVNSPSIPLARPQHVAVVLVSKTILCVQNNSKSCLTAKVSTYETVNIWQAFRNKGKVLER